MAKPYQDGKGWAFRLHMQGQDIFRSGFPSEAVEEESREILRAAAFSQSVRCGLKEALAGMPDVGLDEGFHQR